MKTDIFSLNYKLSFIIPAYNAEKYIEKCILSILDQTYENIEIIAVNDGSTDNTAQIINNLAGKHDKITVKNIENSGVSSARNIGISLATGDYIAFVDADDYIAADYAEYMLGLVTENSSDFCFSKNCFTKNNEAQTEHTTVEILSPEDATALLLSPEVIVGCWNKIFKRSFLENHKIKFATDLFYGEGLYFIISAAQHANNITVGNKKVYYYRRNNEASATTKFNINNFRNGEKALIKIRDDIFLKNNKVETMWLLHFHLFCLGAVVKIKYNCKDKEYKQDYKKYKALLKNDLSNLILSNDISIYRKMMLLCGAMFPGFLGKLDSYRRKKISDNSVSD